jgi:HlyD family secretion protein
MNPAGRSRLSFLSLTLPLLALAFTLAACSRADKSRSAELTLSGNIEVVDAQLGFKVPGRVATRAVSEGEPVKTGQLVASLDDAEQRAQLALRRAELAASEAALAELEAGSRPQEIAAAAASLRSSEAELAAAKLEALRQQELRTKAVISERELEAADARLKIAEARAAEVSERLKLVREGPRAETIRQARARVDQARAAISLAETQLDNTRLSCPLTGTVLSHNIEPGEFVSAGTPVVTVADLLHPWVRVYLGEPELGRVRQGRKVRVRIDSYPDKSYEGTVSFIASEAEFTPKTVQTTKERVKLVFRLKVTLDNATGDLKPGMPADVLLPPAP